MKQPNPDPTPALLLFYHLFPLSQINLPQDIHTLAFSHRLYTLIDDFTCPSAAWQVLKAPASSTFFYEGTGAYP